VCPFAAVPGFEPPGFEVPGFEVPGVTWPVVDVWADAACRA
jgi:hypothetical protein